MRGPPVPPGEPTGLNQERPGQRTEARAVRRAGSRPRGRRPPGSHDPGDGQAVGTVNTCESAIKVVTAQRAKVAVFREPGSGQNGVVGWSAASTLPPRGRCTHRPTAGTYPHMCFESGTWKPRTLLVGQIGPTGERAARHSERRAGLGCRKKRRPGCSGSDTGPSGRTRKRAHVRRVFRCERA